MKERNGKIRKTEPSLPKKLITKKKTKKKKLRIEINDIA